MNTEAPPPDHDFTLWELASTMAVTAERGNKRSRKSKHVVSRLRQIPKLLVFFGTLFLLAFCWSFTSLFPEWPRAAGLMIRIFSLILGITIIIGGIIVGLGDPVYHAIKKGMLRVTIFIWWSYAIFAFPFSGLTVFLSMISIAWPKEAWPSGNAGVTIALSIAAILFPMMTTTLAAPLLTTMVKPRLQQARISRTIWALTLTALVTNLACGAVSFLLYIAGDREPNYDIIVLVGTVWVGLIGATIGWHRRNVERLETHRAQMLDTLGRALDAFDLDGVDSPSVVKTVRELRRLSAPTPFQSQSIAALPHPASYEVSEMIRLIEWAVDPIGDNAIPESITLRAAKDRAHQTSFSKVEAAGKNGVALRSRDFLARCYQRLLTNSDILQ